MNNLLQMNIEKDVMFLMHHERETKKIKGSYEPTCEYETTFGPSPLLRIMLYRPPPPPPTHLLRPIPHPPHPLMPSHGALTTGQGLIVQSPVEEDSKA